MKTRPHPTHHDKYRPNRALWGVIVGLAGVFGCVFLAMVDTAQSPAVMHLAKVFLLWSGALAFVGGTAVASITEIGHRFTRCPSCRRLLVRSRIDYQRSYYRCRRCGVMWTCPCAKMARGY